MWAGSLTLRLGDYHVGVRSSHPELHALVRQALAAHVVEGVDAPPNYSVQLAGHDGAEESDFHFLYRGFTPVVRTRDPHRLVNGLLSHLAGQLPVDAGQLEVNAVALVRDGHAVLCPPDIRQFLPTFERRLHRDGIVMVDRPSATLDPTSRELVVSESALDVDWGALDDLSGIGAEAKRPDPVLVPGRYPVKAWTFGRGAEGAGPLPVGVAVAEATKLVLNMRSLGAATVLDGLHAVLSSVERVALWAEDPEGLIPLLIKLSK